MQAGEHAGWRDWCGAAATGRATAAGGGCGRRAAASVCPQAAPLASPVVARFPLQCIDTLSYGCTDTSQCCSFNLALPDTAKCIVSAGLGRCSACIASNNVVTTLSDGCSASSDCCTDGVQCVRPAGSSVANGVCKDCVDEGQLGCTTAANCCTNPTPNLKCQKPTAADAQGTCKSVSRAAGAPRAARLSCCHAASPCLASSCRLPPLPASLHPAAVASPVPAVHC